MMAFNEYTIHNEFKGTGYLLVEYNGNTQVKEEHCKVLSARWKEKFTALGKSLNDQVDELEEQCKAGKQRLEQQAEALKDQIKSTEEQHETTSDTDLSNLEKVPVVAEMQCKKAKIEHSKFVAKVAVTEATESAKKEVWKTVIDGLKGEGAGITAQLELILAYIFKGKGATQGREPLKLLMFNAIKTLPPDKWNIR